MTQQYPKIAIYKTHFKLKLTYNSKIMILKKRTKSKHYNGDMHGKIKILA